MRRAVIVALVVAAFAPAAMGQAVTGFTGGTQFGIYYTGSTGDVFCHGAL